MKRDVDFVVIGGGPAGEKAATKAAYLGASVVLVEREADLGGKCFQGGLPSKVLRDAALSYSGARRRLGDLFRQPPSHRLPMELFTQATQTLCDAHATRAADVLARHDVELLTGEARVAGANDGANDVVVTLPSGEEQLLKATKILIATGSRPERPSFVPFDQPGVYDSTSLLSITELPAAMVVIGGGVIGSEYASIFAALDVSVTLIDLGERLLPFLDCDLSARLAAGMQSAGVELRLKTRASDISRSGSEWKVSLGEGSAVTGDIVLFSGGRVANTEALGLEAIGVELGRKGRPIVDECMRTTAPNIYAAGDVIGFPALASSSAEQGRVAAAHAFLSDGQPTDRPDVLPLEACQPYPLLPHGIYTIPSMSKVGLSEEEARAKGLDVVVGRAFYADRARGQLVGDDSGMLKLVCDRESQKILGVHIIGEVAEELIHIGQTCMHFGGTVEFFLRSVVNFPTLSSLYKSAAYDMMTRINPDAVRFAYGER